MYVIEKKRQTFQHVKSDLKTQPLILKRSGESALNCNLTLTGFKRFASFESLCSTKIFYKISEASENGTPLVSGEVGLAASNPIH